EGSANAHKRGFGAAETAQEKTGKTVPVPTRKSVSADCPALDALRLLPPHRASVPHAPKLSSGSLANFGKIAYFGGGAMESDDAELIRAHTAKRGAIYRELSFCTITLESPRSALRRPGIAMSRIIGPWSLTL
ncbi:MAG TPA: hypothetical protein VMV69_23905, partial [Pirellulales bacterium]|nr:hypothetical protein [Pirellulales bacterium]